MDDCLFCRIINRELEADIIAESGGAIALKDINPQAPVHLLVMPKEHLPTIKEFAPDNCEVLIDVFTLICELAVSEGVAQSGYRVVVNVGEHAGQDIGHVHFHLLGGRFMKWPPG